MSNEAPAFAPETPVAPIPTATVKRPPGRPRKDGLPAGTRTAAAADKISPPPAATVKHTPAPIDIESLARQLQGLHLMAAEVTHEPAWILTPAEAKNLAVSLAEIARQYSVSVNPKVAAGLQLAGVAAAIYLPRMLAIRAKRETAQREAARSAPATSAPAG